MKITFLKDIQITKKFTQFEYNEIARLLANGATQQFVYTTLDIFAREDWSDLLSLTSTSSEDEIELKLKIINKDLSKYINRLLRTIHSNVATDFMMQLVEDGYFFEFLHIFKHHNTNIDEFNDFFTDLAKRIASIKKVDMIVLIEIGEVIYNTLGLTKPTLNKAANNYMKLKLGDAFRNSIVRNIRMVGKKEFNNWIERQKK